MLSRRREENLRRNGGEWEGGKEKDIFKKEGGSKGVLRIEESYW